MMMPLPPLPPLPPRGCFQSDAAYEIAKRHHENSLRRRSEMLKDEEAALILMAVILIGSAIFSLGLVSVFAFGWRGPFYVVAAGGLLWTAYRQIRVRL